MQVDDNTHTDTNDNGQQKSVDPIERHIDVAIEAQDGTAETKTATDDNKEDENKDKSQQQPKDSTSDTSDDKSQQQPENKAGEAGKKSVAGPKDLVLKDGSIVRAGPERRLYEGRELARQQLTTERQAHQETRRQLEQLQTKLTQSETSIQSVHGVAPSQLALGVRLVTDLQRDPQGTIRKLLTEAASQGINVEGIESGVDMAAIQRMIDERLPKQDAQPTDEQIIAEAKRESETFFSSHPDAKPHDELLAVVMRDHPDLTLEDAYYQVRNAFIEKGFDWNLSLQDNLKALNVSDDPANQNKEDQGNKAPLPKGGNVPSGDFKLADKTPEADDNMDMGDIVRAAMRENGMNV